MSAIPSEYAFMRPAASASRLRPSNVCCFALPHLDDDLLLSARL